MFPFKNRSLIGLDIQEDEVTLLQVKTNKHLAHIERFASLALPHGVIKEGKILAVEQLVTSLIQLKKQAQITTKNTAIALPEYCVLSKHVQLPLMPDYEIEIEMQTHLADYFPGITEEICFDYIVQRTDDGVQNILLIAAKYEMLKDYVDAVSQAGFRVKIVDVTEYALLRALNYYVKSENKILGLLVIKLDCVQCLVLQDKNIIFSQSFPLIIENDYLKTLLHRIHAILPMADHAISEWFVSGKKYLLEKIHLLPSMKIIDTALHSLASFGLAVRG